MKNIAKYWISEETWRVDDNFNLKPNKPVVISCIFQSCVLMFFIQISSLFNYKKIPYLINCFFLIHYLSKWNHYVLSWRQTTVYYTRLFNIYDDIYAKCIWRTVWRYQREVIRIRKSMKDRQHNCQHKKDKRTNNDLQNIHIKLKNSSNTVILLILKDH